MGDAVLQLCVCFCVCVWLRGGRKGSEVLEQKISLLSLLLLFLFLSPGQTYSNSNLCDFTAHWIPKKLTTLYWEARRNGGVGWCYELNKGNLKDRGKWKYVGWGKLHYYCVLSTCFALDPKWWPETAQILITETNIFIEILILMSCVTATIYLSIKI